MKASKYQQAIYKFCADPRKGSAIINAVAGSGKTTTAVEAIKCFPEGLDITFLAFNKAIAEELVDRDVPAKTFHGLTYGPVMRYYGLSNVTVDKTNRIAKKLLPQFDYNKFQYAISKVVGLMKQVGATGDKFLETAYGLIEHHDIDVGDNPDLFIRYLMDVYSEVLRNKTMMDFDDLLYYAATDPRIVLKKYDIVFVDESQDTNYIQRLILNKISKPKTRIIAIGDKHQCHPPGTMIELTGGKRIAIEDVRPGMEVVTYHDCFRGLKTQGRRVLEVSSREHFSGRIKLTAGKETVRVTTNHRIPTRLNLKKQKWALYLMEKNEISRIGVCSLVYKHGFGPTTRMRHEKADKGWVLEVFDNKEDAMIAETLVSLRFGLPEGIFHEKGRMKNRLLKAIGNNFARTYRCLKFYGREYEYPLFQKKESNKHIGKYLYITQACNLIEKINTVRTFDGTQNGGKWTPVSIDREYGGWDKVYSLSVEPTEGGHRLYVADNILVHNSIYGFRGADSQSMQNIQDDFKCEVLNLSVTYRCDKAIVEMAKQYVPQIEAREDAGPGLVKEQNDLTGVKTGDLVISRTTRELIKNAFALLREKKSVMVLGREIGQGLKTLINKMKAVDVADLMDKLENYKTREMSKFIRLEKFNQAQTVEDKVGAIQCLCESANSIQELLRNVDELFADKTKAIKFATIHKSKGLEAKRVFWLDFDYSFNWIKKDWMKEQENNLRYVAITRAKNELYLIPKRK